MAEAYLLLDPHHHGGVVVGPKLLPAISFEREDRESSSKSWATAIEASLPLEHTTPVQSQPLGYADSETPGQCSPSRNGRGDRPAYNLSKEE